MASVGCSLQLSYGLGFCKNHKATKNLKQQHSLSFRLLDSVNRPNFSGPSRYKLLVCQCSILPVRASEIPILKAAATSLARSYSAFHGNPFVHHLVPGLVVIVFAICGLAPLVRHGRNLLFRRGDNSWERSGTYYVTTSYLQPLLLWTGATLVCRALDPVVLSSEASQSIKRRLLVFVRSMSTVLAFSYCLSSLIQQTQQFLMEANDSSDTRNMGFQFAGKAVYSAVWVAAVSLFMELLGFSTQKMLTAGGLGTVLLTLAGREIFTNFLSSMMIHATRPFILNEWIQTKIEGYDVSGTVEHVGWWSPTIIRGDNREAVHIPNHKFTVNVVRNLSQKTHWRIKTYFSISHLDVDKINLVVADMRKVLAKNPQVEQQRLHRRVFLERIDPENQALVVLVSCFVKTSHFEEYLCVKEAILLDLLRVISHHRARLATPIRTVHEMHSEEDMENIPFSDTIFTRARAANNHPFLLIEPPYKINGDDKTKAQTRPARTGEEQDTKVTSSVTSEHTTRAVPPDLNTDTKVGEKTFGSDADYEARMSLSEFDDTTISTKSSPSDTREDTNSAATSLDANRKMSDSMADKKVVATSLASEVTPEVARTLTASGLGNHGSESCTDEQKTHSVDGLQVVKTSSDLSSMPQLEGQDRVALKSRDTSSLKPSLKDSQVSLSDNDSGAMQDVPSTRSQVKKEKTGLAPKVLVSDDITGEVKDLPSATSQVKQETEKLPVPPSQEGRRSLEDNIVLGVALQGSKQTLPIEEGTSTAETKELAACGNGNGSYSAPKDKEGHTIAAPADQRDQER